MKQLTEEQIIDERRKRPVIFMCFGHNGKRYTGQKFETVKCKECKKDYVVEVVQSCDSDYVGFCHAIGPSQCPNCGQNFWYRDGIEK